MNPKVSVIVPIYKVEPYLERCLDSLRRQTLQEVEFILIDDGSPDRCGRIADRYAREDGRFRVIHQENEGLSAARNRGIEAARAPYLMCVDSDDYVEPDFCRIPYECALEQGADLVVFRHWRDGFPKGKKQTVIPREGIFSREEALWLAGTDVGYYAWNKLCHRHLYEGVRYPVGRTFEDVATTCRLIQNAERIYVLDALLYHYCFRSSGIVQTITEKNILDRMEMFLWESKFLAGCGYTKLAERRMTMGALSYLIHMGTKGEQAAPFLRWFREEKKPAHDGDWQAKVLVPILRLSPTLFDLVCALFGRHRWQRAEKRAKEQL